MPKQLTTPHFNLNSQSTLFSHNSLRYSHFQKEHLSRMLLFLFKMAVISTLPLVSAQSDMINNKDITSQSTAISNYTQMPNNEGNSNLLGLTIAVSLMMLILLFRFMLCINKCDNFLTPNHDMSQISNNKIFHNYGTNNSVQINISDNAKTPLIDYPSNKIDWIESGRMTL